MSKVLVIVESPAKAKTIGKFLGTRKYDVKSSMGHIRDLPKSQLGVDLENNFEPKYINIRGKGDLIKDLRKVAKKCDQILLATDPDREGEAIAWHLKQLLNIEDLAPCRIEFHEITKNAIKEAVKNPRYINYAKVNAQQARRVLDRLVGYKLSPLLWKKIKKGLSAGRVQSVTLRLICERENEINAFIPEEYWSIEAVFSNKKKVEFESKLYKIDNKNFKLANKKEVDVVLADLKKAEFIVEDVKKRSKKRNSAPPFTTSSLQQEAYRKLNFTTKKTMMVAQQLYEGIELSKKEGSIGLVTYIRTDSTRVSSEAATETKDFIRNKFGEEFISKEEKAKILKKNAQDAHEAIRPTSIDRTPDSLVQVLSKDQYKLYKLIWERFLASQMAAAIFDVTTVDIKAGRYTFRTTGSILKFKGYRQVYIEGQDESTDNDQQTMLPDLIAGETLKKITIEDKQHFTQPPARFTEATLVKTLEDLGIGRPSTYAPTIETIVARGYVVRENKQLSPTELGFIVFDLLKEFFKDIINLDFTAKLENDLDKIEDGDLEWKKVVSFFYEPFSKELEYAEEQIGEIEIKDEESDVLCEKCGKNMVIKIGRFGKFLACPGFPDCRNTKAILEELDINCPKCKDGKIVIRKTKKGRKFYGCNRFPECDFTSWDEPTNEKCPECNSFMVLKTNKKGNKLLCSNSNCNFVKDI